MYFTVSVLTVIRVSSVVKALFSIHLYSMLLVAAYADYSHNTPTSDAATFPAS